MENDRQQSAKEYAKLKRSVFFLDFGINGFLALLWIIPGFSILLRNLITSFAFPILINNAIFIICYGLIAAIISFPLTLYSEYTLPGKFNLSTETFSNWFLDHIKGTLLSGLIGVPILLLIYWFLSIHPNTWWIWAASIVLLLSVVFANLYPILIAPLFNKFTPLAEQYAELEGKLTALANSAQTHVTGVYQYDMSRRSKTANAALMGLSNSRRIILSDTLLENFSDDEIETVLAHELAHHVHKDIPLSILVNSVLIILSFYMASFGLQWGTQFYNFSSIADIANLPLFEIIFGLFSIVIFPIQNSFSRLLETRADQFSMQLTQKPAAFASALKKLSDQNLSEIDTDPWIEFFLHSHPSLGKRIYKAEHFQEHRNE